MWSSLPAESTAKCCCPLNIILGTSRALGLEICQKKSSQVLFGLQGSQPRKKRLEPKGSAASWGGGKALGCADLSSPSREFGSKRRLYAGLLGEAVRNCPEDEMLIYFVAE